MHQVSGQLKRLRLSGVVETLSARERQAIDGKWSYVDFLARLLEDELERRAQKQLALRVRRASVNTTKTLEGFDFSFNLFNALGIKAGFFLDEFRCFFGN